MVNYFCGNLKVMEKLAYEEAQRARGKSENGFLARAWRSMANRTNRIAASPLYLPNWSILKFQNVKISDEKFLEVTRTEDYFLMFLRHF